MKAIYPILYGLTYALSWPMSLFIPKVRLGLIGRVGLLKQLASQIGSQKAEWLWFHFASSGEFEQCLPILSAIKNEKPELKICLTYFSPSGKRAVMLEKERRKKARRLLDWDADCYSPLDFSWTATAFLSLLNPKAFVAINREVWPGVLTACTKRKVPSFLVASYFAQGALTRVWVYRKWLELFSWIGTVDDSSQKALSEIFPKKGIFLLGDPRIDRVMERKETLAANPPWAPFFEGQLTWVGASLWEPDFEMVLPGLKALQEKKVRLILVPHEPTEKRLKAWKEKFTGAGISVRLWSHFLKMPDEDSALLVDGVGFLAELYRVASLVFVGGSTERRVHSVLEPLAYHCPILTGPCIQNSREAVALRNGGALSVVTSSEQFVKEAQFLLTPGQSNPMIEKGRAFLQSGIGAGRRTAAKILSSL